MQDGTGSDYKLATCDQLPLLLKGLRHDRKLTQAELGEKLGMSQRMVAKLEAHPESASFARVFQALNAMGIDIVLRDRKAKNDPSLATTSKASPW